DIDTQFVQELRAFLFQHQTTRNGRPGGKPRPLSSRQIVNILECLRTVFHWARRAEARRLPADWVMPLTPELIGEPPAKDPLREDKLPLELRIALVHQMDRWQLTHLAFSLVLPMRPDEATGLVISNVNLERARFEFGHRHSDYNFTQGPH